MRKRYFLESCLSSKPGNAYLSALVVFAKKNFLAFSSKKAENWICSKQIQLSPLLFLTLTLILYKRFCRIHLLNPCLHLQRRDWPGLKFWAAENFPPASFRPEQLKTQVFSVGVLLCSFSVDYYPMYGITTLARSWNMKRISSIQFLVETFLEKIEFSNKFLLYLMISAFSVPQSDA